VRAFLQALGVGILALLAASCEPKGPADLGRTAYGFFPVPPKASTRSVLDTFKALGDHGDVVLIQQNIPWTDFVASPDGGSRAIRDIRNQKTLANRNGLSVIFVVDPLNGLNRREFKDLPADWEASFGDPRVRAAFSGTEQDQVDYLEAIHNQIGGDRLAFWIYLLINDMDLDSYVRFMEEQGEKSADIDTLGIFAHVGLTEIDRTAKPALAVWDSFR